MGESSAQTGIRELKEETGLESEFIKEIGMIGNFFTSSFTNKKIHEILLINELKFVNESVYDKNIINNIEVQKEKKNT